MATLIRLRDRVRRTTFGSASAPTLLALQGDRDLLPVAILLWLASTVRVGYVLWEGEIFSAEATLALSCVLLIPWLFRSSLTFVPQRRNLPTSPEGRASLEPAGVVVPLESLHAARARRDGQRSAVSGQPGALSDCMKR